jgi:lipid II:glycine glycyltransferase (peptidoglycan interpeptide bridge formation enzyme)
LWKKLGQKTRNAVRKAESEGFKVFIGCDAKKQIDIFNDLYKEMAREKGLRMLVREELLKMAENKDLHVVICENKVGRACLANLIYIAGRKSIYLHGANSAELQSGGGQLAQWETILALKAAGIAWYDLGGVQDGVPIDGIHRFKKSIGGTFCQLGREYRYQSFGHRIARAFLSLSRH